MSGSAVGFRPSPDLYPFVSRWFESSAGRVHYVDEGQGVPILFCHGNPTWSFLYRGIVIRLRDRFRCVAVDYPGFGLSDRPPAYGYTPGEHARVVGELVDHLALDGLVVMGQDWGGPIGTWVATSKPERIQGLVLGNTWIGPSDRLASKVFSRVLSSPPMRQAILRANAFVELLLPLGVARRLSPEVMEHYRAVQPTPDAREGVAEFPRQILAARPWLAELEGRVAASLSSKPVLLTWGMRDPVFRPRLFLPLLRATFGDVTLVRLTEAKHFIQEDAPGEIADAIARRFG